MADRGRPARRWDGLRGRELGRFAATSALIVLGVGGLAVTQPLLDLFGSNAEFFVAGDYSTPQIVTFALIVALVPPTVGVAVVICAGFVDRDAGTVALATVSAVFAAAFVLAVTREIGVDETWFVIVLAVGLAVAVGWLVGRSRPARLFIAYLSAANLLFVGTFLFASETSALVIGEGTDDPRPVSVPDLRGPVVMIVFDELPAATIMAGDGTINEERYPGFARLGEVSTWFRNASSRGNWTPTAVPAMLTGRAISESVLPTFENYPRNLFTLLGNDVPIRRYEPVTDLCPDDLCAGRDQAAMTQALSDASIVYGHRVLPSSLRDHLPAIDNSWGAYGVDGESGVAATDDDDDDDVTDAGGTEPTNPLFERWQARPEDERSARGQAAKMTTEIAAITGDPALHFVHINLPHFPWTLSPSGYTTTYTPARRPADIDASQPGYDFRIRVEFQRHSMQAGAVDALLDQTLDELMALPTWDDMLLVVTSDHGISLTPPDVDRRRVTEANRAEVYRVPVFVKAPGQTTGETHDESAQTIDIVPSIVDLLDIEVDDEWEFDGHSLYDGSEPTVAPRVSTDVDEVLALARRRSAEFEGDDWNGLAGVGENGDLVGRALSDLSTGEPSEYRATLRDEALFQNLPTDDGAMPYVLTGTITGPPEAPPELVAAVNGRVAGVVGGYNPSESGWEFIGYVADFFVDGANTIDLYEVSHEADTATLRPVRR